MLLTIYEYKYKYIAISAPQIYIHANLFLIREASQICPGKCGTKFHRILR